MMSSIQQSLMSTLNGVPPSQLNSLQQQLPGIMGNISQPALATNQEIIDSLWRSLSQGTGDVSANPQLQILQSTNSTSTMLPQNFAPVFQQLNSPNFLTSQNFQSLPANPVQNLQQAMHTHAASFAISNNTTEGINPSSTSNTTAPSSVNDRDTNTSDTSSMEHGTARTSTASSSEDQSVSPAQSTRKRERSQSPEN